MIDSLSDKDLLQQFSSKSLEALENNTASIEDKVTSRKIESCLPILKLMGRSDSFDKKCPFNAKFYKTDILSQLQNWAKKPYDLNNLDELFIICMAFSREYLLFQKRCGYSLNSEVSRYWEKFKADVEQKIYPLEKDFLKEQAEDIRNIRDIDILNHYLGQKGYQAFLNYEKTVKNAEERIGKLQEQLNDKEEQFNKQILEKQEEFNEEILKREEKVNNLRDDLKKLETGFNFVGLSQGFESLLNKKNRAKWWTFAGLVTLLLAALVPLNFSFYKFIQGDDLSWQKMLPVIGLEFVLIYFFRVVLTHYHSIQTQIMQLELRQSLCQFIQSYAEYAKEIKASDKDALEKFENLIFSSILSNPDKVPGTFDGIDSLTTLLKEFKK